MAGPSDAQINSALREALTKSFADIRQSSDQHPSNVKKMFLDLSTAQVTPLKIGWPFRAVFVSGATDAIAQVNLALHSADQSAIDEALPLILNRSVNFDNAIAAAYVTWAAQPGKTMTIFFGIDANIQSGSLLSLNAGGVSISEGASTTARNFAIAAATQTLLFSSNALRKTGTWVNETGGACYVGGAAVTKTGANKGILVGAGGVFQWKNSAALYVWSDVAYADAATMEES